MTKQGLVTIMMPVLNGELFLPFALDSLLAQDYPHFEIVILDNQSTDRTGEICRRYQGQDRRIRYIRDRVNRISHDAANHLAEYIEGEFCMLACDDDLWAPNFLSTLVKYLKEHPEVGLVYPNARYVDVEGNMGGVRLLSRRHIYSYRDSRLRNLWRYVGQRRVVPTIFGLYRSRAYLQSLPFDTFDETIADVDNLFLIKLLTQFPVQGLEEVLFYYRNKYRGFDPSLSVGRSIEGSAVRAWIYLSKHQWRFLGKIVDVIAASKLHRATQMVLIIRSFYTFLLAVTVWRLKAALVKGMVQLGLREGPLQEKDVHFEKRSAALHAVGYDPLNKKER
jgi:glycosyltransferase involved in cell wall biosynthesis